MAKNAAPRDDAPEDGPAALPVEQQIVEFYGDVIPVALVPNGELYFALRPVTDALGLAPNSQRARINREPLLAEGTTTLQMRGADGRQRAMFCLRVNLLNIWLVTIDTSRVRADLQDKISRYKRECAEVLWRHFQDETLAALAPSPRPPDRFTQELVQIREMALALAHMADAQLALNARVAAIDTRLDKAADVVLDLRRRLGQAERRLDPASILTEEQAAALSAKVKALGLLLTDHDPSKNHFQGIFAELYRRYRISDYKHLRRHQFDAAMAFLDEWGTHLRPPAES